MDVYTVIKTITITTFCYVMYLKVSGWRATVLKRFVFGFIFTVTFAPVMWVMMEYVSEPFKSLLILLPSSLILKMATEEKFDKVLINTAVAFAVSHVLFIFATSVALFIPLLFFGLRNNDIETALLNGTMDNIATQTALLAIVIEIVFTIIVMKVKLHLPLIQKRGVGGMILSISGIVMILYGLYQREELSETGWSLLLSCVILCAANLIYWLKRESAIAFSAKASDIEKLRLKKSLVKAEEENRFLDGVLRYLEGRLYAEDKRLPAYQKAVEFLVNETPDETIRRKAMKVLNELRIVRDELSQKQSRELRKIKTLPPTSMALLDAVITHMFDMAA